MPPSPFQRYIDQIGQLIRMAERSTSRPLTGKVTPEMEEAIKRVELYAKTFRKLNQSVINQLGPMRKFEECTPREQLLLKQLRELGLKLSVLGGGLMDVEKKVQSKQREISKNTKKSIQQRKNKFRGIGGRENWQRT